MSAHTHETISSEWNTNHTIDTTLPVRSSYLPNSTSAETSVGNTALISLTLFPIDLHNPGVAYETLLIINILLLRINIIQNAINYLQIQNIIMSWSIQEMKDWFGVFGEVMVVDLASFSSIHVLYTYANIQGLSEG